jgi:hypothetical protein
MRFRTRNVSEVSEEGWPESWAIKVRFRFAWGFLFRRMTPEFWSMRR